MTDSNSYITNRFSTQTERIYETAARGNHFLSTAYLFMSHFSLFLFVTWQSDVCIIVSIVTLTGHYLDDVVDERVSEHPVQSDAVTLHQVLEDKIHKSTLIYCVVYTLAEPGSNLNLKPGLILTVCVWSQSRPYNWTAPGLSVSCVFPQFNKIRNKSSHCVEMSSMWADN